GSRVAGPYGVALIVASFAAIAIAVSGQRGLLRPGPAAAWTDISNAVGFLLIASVFTQFLLSIGPVAVQLLKTHAEAAAAGRFLNSRIIAYIPIFLFQAVQAALLPRLAALAASGQIAAFR